MAAGAATLLTSCLVLAAQAYGLPPAVLSGIMKAEGGKIGQQVRNTNDTYDLGPMQINTLWVPVLATEWDVSETQAHEWIRDDACTNMNVSAWILKNHYLRTGVLAEAIAAYHSRTPHIGGRYKQRVLKIMVDNGLVVE